MIVRAHPHHPAGATMSRRVDIEHDTGIIGSTEPDNLPNSGTPHPSERGIFMPVIQAHTARFLSREGWRINRKANTQRGLLAVISLPAPFIRSVSNLINQQEAIMASNTSRPNQGNITKSRIRIILAAEYGPENVRITKSGEIHIRGNMPNTDQDGWYLWGQVGNPDTQARLRQLPGAALSQSDADHLDGSIYDIADRLENLVALADGLVSYYQAIPELREILRRAKTASQAIEKAKSPARVLWSLSMEVAVTEGRS